MSPDLELACTVCSEEFRVTAASYSDVNGVVECPCCGSDDLVLLGWAVGSLGDRDASAAG